MDETDTSNHQASGNARKRPADSSRQALITLERSQKLDLLIHLLTNLQQPLVLCGPEGIGKTTLLDILRAREISSWHICSIKATAQLSFERVQQLLLESAKQASPDLKHYQLPEILEHFTQKKEKLVVLLDDAGELVPGMITALYQFATANPVLRLVFVLTPDQLHVKSSSDKVIEDCHFIELPPLTEQQCGEFLQNLSSKPGAAVSFNAISPAMVEKLYRDTHGIPGKIMAVFPTLDSYAPATAQKRMLLSILAAAVIAVGIGYLLWGQQETLNTPQRSSSIRPESRKVEISPPVIMPAAEGQSEQLETTVSQQELPEKAAQTPAGPSAENSIKAPPVTPEEAIETAAPETMTVAARPADNTTSAKPAEPQAMPELNETTVQPLNIEKTRHPSQVKTPLPPPQEISPAVPGPETAQQPAATTALPGPVPETTGAAAAKQQTATPPLTEKMTPPAASLNTAEATVPAAESKPTPAEKNETDSRQPVEAKPKTSASTAEKPKPASTRKSAENDDSQWLLQQPARNYTLQLMALSKRQAAQQVLRKYSNLPQPVKYVHLVRKGREKFVVVYGSYATTADAAKAKKTLPAALRNTWLRRISGLQKQVVSN